jgi:hypothetical protein
MKGLGIILLMAVMFLAVAPIAQAAVTINTDSVSHILTIVSGMAGILFLFGALGMAVGQAYLGNFSLGTNKVGSITKWGIAGMANKLIDATVFEDQFEKFMYGQGNGGKVTFSGYFDPADTTGQIALHTAWKNKTTLATGTTNDPRIYYSAAGYFKLSTGAECLIESLDFGEADMSGLVPFSVTLQVSGGYFEKNA